ncbi:MAG: hypothetical protein MUC64_15210 [Rubritepida sp.]|nr:hypothetical protein [Rubritepida sp.]
MSGAPPGEPPRRGRLGALQAALPLLVPVFGGLILAFILFDELNRDDIEVRPIAVPARLAEAGFTPEVAALRLMDALLELQASVGAEPRRRTGDATGPHPDFTVPLTGLSLRSLASALRDSFGLPERRVTGEVTQEGETLRLRLRLSGQGVIADVAAATPDALLRAGAPQVWRAVQPVLYAWWLAGEAPTEASMREALSTRCCRTAPATRPPSMAAGARCASSAGWTRRWTRCRPPSAPCRAPAFRASASRRSCATAARPRPRSRC